MDSNQAFNLISQLCSQSKLSWDEHMAVQEALKLLNPEEQKDIPKE